MHFYVWLIYLNRMRNLSIFTRMRTSFFYFQFTEIFLSWRLGILMPWCQQGSFFLRLLLLSCRWPPSCSCTGRESKVSVVPSYKGSKSHHEVPTLIISSNSNYLPKAPLHQGIRLHMNFERTQHLVYSIIILEKVVTGGLAMF